MGVSGEPPTSTNIEFGHGDIVMTHFNRTIKLSALLLVFVVATSTNLRAQLIAVTAGEFTKVGLSGGQFLKIGVGARGTGMAGAYSGVANDLSAVYWNAAGLVDVEGYGADFSHTFWFGGMSHSFAALVMPVSEKFRLAASFTSFGSGDILLSTTDAPGGNGGTYSVSDVAIGVTLAGYLTKQFSFGATAKFVSHAFTNTSAQGFVFDVGTRYKTGFNGITLGFSINSLGTKQTFTGSDLTRENQAYPGLNASPIDMQIQASSFDMPLSFRAGIGVDMFEGFVADQPTYDGSVQVHDWIVAADFETFADVPEQFALGTEYTFREFVSFRAGYRFGSDQFGLAGGVGLKYKSGSFDGRIDYSINPTQNIGLVNRLSVAINFD